MKTPKYRLHKASGQAVVSIRRKDHYLGPWNSPESIAAYKRVLAEADAPALSTGPTTTVVMLAAAYLAHHKKKHAGKAHGPKEHHRAKRAIGVITTLYGHVAVSEIKSRALTAVQSAMLGNRWSARYVSKCMIEIRRCWRWAVGQELADPSALAYFAAIEPPRGNNPPPRADVTESDVHATLPHLSEPYAAMVRLLWLTGMRPEECLAMRIEEIDRKPLVWVYRPTDHKSAWRRHGREILLGPQCQAILTAGIGQRRTGYVFPSRAGRYRTETLAHEVADACKLAGVKWTPYSLRHAALTRLSAQFGPDIARRIAGHRSLSMTARYDHMDLTQAAEVMAKVG